MMNDDNNQSPPEKAKAQYTNGCAITSDMLIDGKNEIKADYPIYDDDCNLIGFINLGDNQDLPRKIVIRDFNYIKADRIA